MRILSGALWTVVDPSGHLLLLPIIQKLVLFDKETIEGRENYRFTITKFTRRLQDFHIKANSTTGIWVLLICTRKTYVYKKDIYVCLHEYTCL